ncbi:hypothetical protein [Halomonas sp.]|uniref:Hpr(Ser) kinase/phosphatase n=2 Tax=Halomonas ventosae TaxID=229007 RepID=A0A4V3C234_9GAMM|nr:Hpr(Ser) kinase/phosphatase [Halomonas ventosae]
MPRFYLFGFDTLANIELTTSMAEAPSSAAPELSFSCLPADSAGRQGCTGNVLYLSKRLNGSGESRVQLFEESGTTWLMRFPGIADFFLRPGEIECRLVDPALAFMVNVLLLGHVMACYLERQGILALHAGALAVGDHAVLLAGHKGAGKSTLVTSMVTAGFPLMADDIAAVEARDGSVPCRSAFPQLKLTPEQLGCFMTDGGESYPRFHPGFTKLSVPVVDLGAFDLGPRPVGAIYLLERESCDVPVIERLPPARAVVELARHSFLGHMLERTSLQRERFAHLARLAQAVPVKRLRYPNSFDHLADVHAAIARDQKAGT